jgi:Kdo2-lipid IVA lauroyltransferase/acyltransferase
VAYMNNSSDISKPPVAKKKRKKKSGAFLHILEYVGMLFFYYTIRVIPLTPAMHIGKFLARIISSVFPFRKKIILANLKRAFPLISDKKAKKIMRSTYENMLFLIVEFIHLEGKTKEEMAEYITEIEGEEHITQFKDSGKSFLGLSAHFGNWEFLGIYFSMMGYPISVVSKPIHNPYIAKFVNNIRFDTGMKLINTRKNPVSGIFRALKNNECVTFLSDQDARRTGIFINHFGTPASTFSGPAVFSIRSGLPLLPAFDVRTGLTTHKIIILPPVYPEKNIEDRNEAVYRLTEKHVRILEDIIRKYPDQYFWFHQRWKTRPKNTK